VRYELTSTSRLDNTDGVRDTPRYLVRRVQCVKSLFVSPLHYTTAVMPVDGDSDLR